jgi:S-adenosyl methyltransferase
MLGPILPRDDYGVQTSQALSRKLRERGVLHDKKALLSSKDDLSGVHIRHDQESKRVGSGCALVAAAGPPTLRCCAPPRVEITLFDPAAVAVTDPHPGGAQLARTKPKAPTADRARHNHHPGEPVTDVPTAKLAAAPTPRRHPNAKRTGLTCPATTSGAQCQPRSSPSSTNSGLASHRHSPHPPGAATRGGLWTGASGLCATSLSGSVTSVDSDEPAPHEGMPDLVTARSLDTTKASIARVYDCFLGGKDHYEVDRHVFNQVDKIAPQMKRLARDHRKWLVRVARFLADSADIDQFLDCGAGLPTAENTHQAAQRLNPEARVVYVDNDPIVAAHGRALLENNEETRLVVADLTKPDEVFSHPAVNKLLDLSRPIALIQCSTIHHVPDSENPHEIMKRYRDLLPSGSYVALTHFCDPEDGGAGSNLARFIEDIFTEDDSMGSGYFRSRSEIEAFFGDLELVDPGVARLNDWWPDGPSLKPRTVEDEVVIGGLARKP